MSPGCTRCGPSRSSASTTPVAAPARSKSSGPKWPGCSAVSPPIRAQPACTHPSATPDRMVAARSGWRRAEDHVVGHEQRFRPAHHQVVHDHPDQVDADRVVDPQPAGDAPPWCPRRRSRWPAAAAAWWSAGSRRTARRTRPGHRSLAGRWSGRSTPASGPRRARPRRCPPPRHGRYSSPVPAVSSRQDRGDYFQQVLAPLGLGDRDRVLAVEAGPAQPARPGSSSPR